MIAFLRFLTTAEGLFKLIPTFLMVLLACHVFGCVWHYVAYFNEFEETWIYTQGIEDRGMWERYIYSMYFVMQTITTVGYGDIVIGTEAEFLLAAIFMFFGVFFYTKIITIMIEIILEYNMKAIEMEHKLHLLSDITKEVTGIPRNMISSIKNQISYSYSKVDQDIVPKFEGVNNHDVEQLFYEAYRSKLLGIQMFEKMFYTNKKFVIEFGENMELSIFRKGSIIYQKGDPATDFYVIKEGSVSFLLPGINFLEFFGVEKGYFGEIEILEETNREYTCVATTHVKCFKLEKSAFTRLFLNGSKTIRESFLLNNQQRKKLITRAMEETMNLYKKTKKELRDTMKNDPLERWRMIVNSEKFKTAFLLKEAGKAHLRKTRTKKMTFIQKFKIMSSHIPQPERNRSKSFGGSTKGTKGLTLSNTVKFEIDEDQHGKEFLLDELTDNFNTKMHKRMRKRKNLWSKLKIKQKGLALFRK